MDREVATIRGDFMGGSPARAGGRAIPPARRSRIRYLRLCMYATSASISAGASLAYFAGIGGFPVDFDFFAISTGLTIHSRISAADSLAPTLSSGLFLFPLPAIIWQTIHFWAP